jgi:hypothetical protein
MLKGALLLMPMLALATSAFAQARPVGLSDSQEPGSVIIFPKFINMPAVVVDGQLVPRTEIEIGAVCPPLASTVRNLVGCAEHQPVKVRFHWVCPGVENVNSNICRETDFDVNLSVWGKLAFTADGTLINSNSPVVPAAPCPRGYLIGWVINGTATGALADAPIKFDALIGNAVIRGPNLAAGPNAGSSTAVSAYSAITIQANTGDATGAPLGSAGSSSPLVFTSANTTGTYQAITGVEVGDVRFDKTAPGAPLPNVLSETFLTFLTLDVRSNQPNNPTFVNLDFYNESDALPSATNPNFERLLSTFLEFVCWDQVQLSTIDANLTQAFMGTRKGIVVAGPAVKIENGAPGDGTGNVTLIGLIETIEGTVANGFQERKYNFNMQNDSFPVNTTFFPRPGG